MLTGKEIALTMSYFGDFLPKYVKKNLNLISIQFPNQKKVFISDNPNSLKKARNLGWESLYVNLENEASELKERLLHDTNFRYGYWFKVIGRILILDKVLELGYSVIQIESDVRLFVNFPFAKFQEHAKGIAYSLHTDKTGSAAILYLRDMGDFRLLKDYFLRAFDSNGQTTDMEILSRMVLDHSDRVTILPTIFSCKHQANKDADISKVRIAQENSKRFDGVFDDLSYGWFLFGVDPRNNLGKRVLFTVLPGQLAKPENVTLTYREGTLSLTCSECKESYSIFNLHVHSKNLTVFSLKGFLLLCVKRNRQKKQLAKNELTFNLVSRKIKSLRDSIRRNLVN